MALVKVFGRAIPDNESVTFTKTEVQFSVGAVKKNELERFKFIRLAYDPGRRRLYFGFEQKDHKEAISFYQQENRTSRRMCSAAGLYSRFEFIKEVRDRADRNQRRFDLLPVNMKDKEATPNRAGGHPNYSYYIQL